MSKLLDLMKTAMSNGIKAPKLRLGNYKFSKAASKDVIWVTDQQPFGSNTFFGKIALDSGVFYPSPNTSKELVKEIVDLMYNAESAAKVYGRKTGMCCCCGRTLINKTSIRLMVGPICLAKYGFSPAELTDTEEPIEIRLEDV